METGENGDPTAHVPYLVEMVRNQEPVRVATQRHLGAVVIVLVAHLNQLAVIMEHAQVKKKSFNTLIFIFKAKID